MDNLAVEILKVIPSVAWFLLVVALLAIFYRPIRDELIPRLSGLKAMGVEFSFVQGSLNSAVELAEKSPEWHVEVPSEAKDRAVRRAMQHPDLLRNALFLWVDDLPQKSRNERRMFQHLGARVDIATNTEEALRKLAIDDYDLVVSDIARGDNAAEGLDFLKAFREQDKSTPAIFYVGVYEPEKGLPTGAAGITNRPDELLHLVFDSMERTRM